MSRQPQNHHKLDPMTTTTIYREIEITVDFNHVPEYLGLREFGASIEPDEPAYNEFINAHDADGKEIDLTGEELKMAQEQVDSGD